jgi:hypothetical protein
MDRVPISVKDRDGKTVRAGDIVRIVGVPNLERMKQPYRGQTARVFQHIKGQRKRVDGFDQFGCAILFFTIRKGHSAGHHSVAIEPELIRRLNLPRQRPYGT